MIRKSTINLKFANKGKLKKLKEVAEEYRRVVNIFIDILWRQQQFSGSFVNNTNVDTWLSARMRQAAAKQALSIVKSQRKKKKNINRLLINWLLNLIRDLLIFIKMLILLIFGSGSRQLGIKLFLTFHHENISILINF